MQYITIDSTNFNGIKTSDGSSAGFIQQANNWDVGVSKDGATLFHGFVTKPPKSEALGNTIAASASRGVHLFNSSASAITIAARYLQGFSDGTMRWLDGTNVWTTLNSGYYVAPIFGFADFIYLDRAFWTNGREAPRKWGRDWDSGCLLQDKSNTATALSGKTTWTAAGYTVTGISTLFTTQTQPGTWIRGDSADDWYEVANVIDAHELTIISPYVDITHTFISGMSQKAATSTIRARFVEFWNDRLFWACGETGGLPIVGTTKVDTDPPAYLDTRLP
jgi:hypothetical protein